MAIKLHNTYTRAIEELRPIQEGEVRLYTCGPTVHDYAHIGNFRTYVFEDLLRRYLRYRGYRVVQVMNITDVEDKIIRKAREAGQSIRDYTEAYTQAFFEDVQRLGIEPAEHYPRATDYVPEMIALIQKLQKAGVTYESEGSIYYRIAAFKDYGKLSGIDLAGVRPGARVDVDEYEKEDARDFVLWKAAKEGEPSWESPWGPGRPGWHIECSAMSMKLLGETLDIHTGGADNIFPHHENEIAQSVMATGKPFVRLWVHSEYLLVSGEKMSKSKGNFYTVRDLMERGVDPAVLRFLLARVHYRKQLNFTFEGLDDARSALEGLLALRTRLSEYRKGEGGAGLQDEIEEARAGFERAMDDDLNASEALAAIFTLRTRLNQAIDRAELSDAGRDAALALLARFDAVFAVLRSEEAELPSDLRALVDARQRARADRSFQEADRLRQDLKNRGVEIEDTRQGSRVTYKGRPVRISS